MIIYGLFEYVYDYCEFRELECASFDKEKLIKYHEDSDTFASIVDMDKHEELAGKGITHRIIEEILLV